MAGFIVVAASLRDSTAHVSPFAYSAFGRLREKLAGLFSVGRLLRWYSPISDYKVKCWRKKLQGDLEKLDKFCEDLISNNIERINERAWEELQRASDEKKANIQDEEEKSHKLTTWSKELQKRHTRLTEINKEFDQQLAE